MNALTSAPHNLVIGTCDGIDIRFAGVELHTAPRTVGPRAGQPSISIHLNGVRASETIIRDGLFIKERLAWADRRRTTPSDSTEDPPKMPGVLLLERLSTHITDDLGTKYRCTGGKVGGDGTEWEATWIFVPAPPDSARTLRLEFEVDGRLTGKHCEIGL